MFKKAVCKGSFFIAIEEGKIASVQHFENPFIAALNKKQANDTLELNL